MSTKVSLRRLFQEAFLNRLGFAPALRAVYLPPELMLLAFLPALL